jgi:hypothetical protein
LRSDAGDIGRVVLCCDRSSFGVAPVVGRLR